jgi:hypothetical protein
MKHFREIEALDADLFDDDISEALELIESLNCDAAAHSRDEHSEANLTFARYADRHFAS